MQPPASGEGSASPRRFWVRGEAEFWWIDSGAIDLFVQQVGEDGELSGTRHHVVRMQAGELFTSAGAQSLRDRYALLCVPLPGASLRRLPSGASVSDAEREPFARACAKWAESLSRAVPRPVSPRVVDTLEDDVEFELAASHVLQSGATLVWMEVTEGNGLWMERYDSVVNAASGPLPLPRDLWVSTESGMRGRGVEAVQLLAEGRIAAAMGLYQRYVLSALLDKIEQMLRGERTRIEIRAQQSVVLANVALRGLLNVTASRRDMVNLEQRRDACMEACGIVGRAAGIEFRAPHAAELAGMERDPVRAIADASRVRYRRVALSDKWWTGDNGPLLAVREADGGWVALVPDRKGYMMHVEGNGDAIRVDEGVASTLKPFAWMFYRSLPTRVLSLADLARFLLHGQGGLVAVVLSIGMFIGLLGTTIPIATGIMVDQLIPEADIVAVYVAAAALLSIAVVSSVLGIVRTMMLTRLESRLDYALQAAIWDRVLRLPVPFFRRYPAGDLALRINAVTSIRQALSQTTVSTLFAGVFSIFNFALLFYYSPLLAAVAALLVALAAAVVLVIGVLKLRYERHLSEEQGRLAAKVFEYLQGLSKLRLGCAESRAFANWARVFARFRRLQFQAEHLENVSHTLLTGYSTLVTAAIFAVIGFWLAHESGMRMSTGEFIAFSAAFGGFFGGMVGLAETVLDVLHLVPVYERAKPIFETLPEADERKAHPGELQGGLELANVCFSYAGGPQILENVSLQVRPGGYIALVGPSGSGKSTLLRLLLGFEKPSSGTVYYDHQDLASLDVQAVRRQLGVVLQNGRLIAGDIFSNIVGAGSLTLEDAWEAARMVGLDEDIEQMPMGMHTVISEGMSTLSGGQRQRILIARALVHRPRLLFFDEATSALDNRTQAIVMRTLERLKTTRIVVAHRLSTIVNADRIVVIDAGRVVQSGSYEALLAQPGVFAQLASRQIA